MGAVRLIYFVGAGCGASDLITVRGWRLLEKADVVIYAGSLVNPALLEVCKPQCQIYNSAGMTLDEVLQVMIEAADKLVVRLHTGDPSLYGAIQEQMDALDKMELSYEVCPGVSSMSGAAAALKREYTLPGISQSVIVCRMEGQHCSARAGAAGVFGNSSGYYGYFFERRTYAAGAGILIGRRLCC